MVQSCASSSYESSPRFLIFKRFPALRSKRLPFQWPFQFVQPAVQRGFHFSAVVRLVVQIAFSDTFSCFQCTFHIGLLFRSLQLDGWLDFFSTFALFAAALLPVLLILLWPANEEQEEKRSQCQRMEKRLLHRNIH